MVSPRKSRTPEQKRRRRHTAGKHSMLVRAIAHKTLLQHKARVSSRRSHSSSPRKSMSPRRIILSPHSPAYQHVTRRGPKKTMPLQEIIDELPIELANAELLAIKQEKHRAARKPYPRRHHHHKK